MTVGLRRCQREGDLHLVTVSCYRLPYLGLPAARDCFEASLEAARVKPWVCGAGVCGDAGACAPACVGAALVELSRVMNGLKSSVGKRLPQSPIWTPRYHDFNVFSAKKVYEKIKYLHENPVARGLVPLAEMWN